MWLCLTFERITPKMGKRKCLAETVNVGKHNCKSCVFEAGCSVSILWVQTGHILVLAGLFFRLIAKIHKH